MYTSEQIANIIHKEFPFLEKEYGINYVGLFGSYAKGKQNRNSDIDFLIDFSEDAPYLIEELNQYLQSIFNVKIHLTSIEMLVKPLNGMEERKVSKNIIKEVIKL